MNRENMNRLADALDSGKYVQGDSVLRSPDNKFCCLGVACDISGLGTWEPQSDQQNYKYVIPNVTAHGEIGTALFTKSMCQWLGTTDMGLFTVPGDGGSRITVFSLTEINDSGEFTFSMIADILRCEAIVWHWLDW